VIRTPRLDWPLMRNNVTREDLDGLISFLQQDDPLLTQSAQVAAFEAEWSRWLGVRHSVMVNSGSSANLITMAALRERSGPGEVIVPALTWVSDIASVLQAGLTPVFVDIDLRTLGMQAEAAIARLTDRTRAVFLTHILGYNALEPDLLDALRRRGIPLIEDVCESHGATFQGRKLGSLGLASNFSFYYAHHLSTVEGGMVCTDDGELYQTLRMLRAHGLVREASDTALRQRYHGEYPDLNPDFIFSLPAYNVRSTEINAVLGRSQLRRLDANNERRRQNLARFLGSLDSRRYYTEFDQEGSCNYALTLLLRHPDQDRCARLMSVLKAANVEFRRGMSGGGNQLRQPYLRRLLGNDAWRDFPNAEHVHFFGFYIGNYPDLEAAQIDTLTDLLNSL